MSIQKTILSIFFGLALSVSTSTHAQSHALNQRQDFDLGSDIKGWFGFGGGPRAATQVNAKIWRSGEPTEQSLTALYAQGVRIIIDLEDDANVVKGEAILAKRLGFTFFSYPTDSFFAPDDAKINEILQILKTAQQPVLVHCFHGEDRTGLVIGLERVLLEGWKPNKAYQEMLDNGFHPLLLGLDQYFRAKVSGF